MIHIDEAPEGSDGLQTYDTDGKTDIEVMKWLDKIGVFEAWIYNNSNGVRVVSWYE